MYHSTLGSRVVRVADARDRELRVVHAVAARVERSCEEGPLNDDVKGPLAHGVEGPLNDGAKGPMADGVEGPLDSLRMIPAIESCA